MLDIFDKYDIFFIDLNNCIVDVAKYHYEAWLITLKSIVGNNFEISYNYFCEKFHSKDLKSLEHYITKTLNLGNLKELMILKNANYMEILKKNEQKIKLIDGFEIFLDNILKQNKKFIIMSDTFLDNVLYFNNLFPILNSSYKCYHRELYNNDKFTANVYLSIINEYSTNKLCYITYYISVIDLLHEKINIIYLNSEYYNNVHYKYISENYKVLCVKDYYSLDHIYLQNKIINTVRLLSIDMINSANSGHPGMPLGCAPTLYVLFCKIMNFNPNNPLSINRDRFILSNGHGCALLYSLLHLLGYNYTLDDLKNFRQLNSITHGHPEYNPKLGIEVTTGPLGQGIANGVGMAIASKKLQLNNKIYVMCGDGCLMEGISYEACSLAGHLELNNLVLLYDDNGITIDGYTDITFTENIKKRFKSQNWNILEVLDGNNNIDDIYNKLMISKYSDKPTIIIIKTTIGYGSLKSNTSACHGFPLGEYGTSELKKNFNFDPNKNFFIDDDVKQYFKMIIRKKTEVKITNLNDINTNIVSDDLFNDLTVSDKPYATRELSNFCLNHLINKIDNIIVGSADLAESTKTIINSNHITKNDFSGKYLHYGIREHAMCAIANGLSTFNILPIVSTFLVFINYCLSSIRLAALSKHKVIYILTHDSVFIGEDGPTHQPIESLTILRSIPNLLVFRPCNLNELCHSYKNALKYNGPSCLILTRQPIINIINNNNLMDIGGYIVYNVINPKIILVATGSEVSLAIEVAKELNNIRVVSMYSLELFENQLNKREILPDDIVKISLEAGLTTCWYKYVNYTYGIDQFGKCGKIDDIKKYYKFTKECIIEFIDDKLSNLTKRRKNNNN
jgi:transketolase